MKVSSVGKSVSCNDNLVQTLKLGSLFYLLSYSGKTLKIGNNHDNEHSIKPLYALLLVCGKPGLSVKI